MNSIKIFQNIHVLSFSVENNYSEDQLMHPFLDKFHQGRRYSSLIAIHLAYIGNKKSVSISSLQTYYLNMDSSSVIGRNIKGAKTVHRKCNFCEGDNHSAEK